MVQRFLYPEELITCKGGKKSHIIVKKWQSPSLLTRTGYITCGVPCTMKMWSLLFKSYEGLPEGNSTVLIKVQSPFICEVLGSCS